MARPGAFAASRSSRYLTAARSSSRGGDCPPSIAASTAATDRSPWPGSPEPGPPRRSALARSGPPLPLIASPLSSPASLLPASPEGGDGTSPTLECRLQYIDLRGPRRTGIDPDRTGGGIGVVNGTSPTLGCR